MTMLAVGPNFESCANTDMQCIISSTTSHFITTLHMFLLFHQDTLLVVFCIANIFFNFISIYNVSRFMTTSCKALQASEDLTCTDLLVSTTYTELLMLPTASYASRVQRMPKWLPYCSAHHDRL